MSPPDLREDERLLPDLRDDPDAELLVRAEVDLLPPFFAEVRLLLLPDERPPEFEFDFAILFFIKLIA